MGKNKTTNKTQKQKNPSLSANLYSINKFSQKFPNTLKRPMLWLWTDENLTIFPMQIIRRSLFCSKPISSSVPLSLACPHGRPWRAGHFQPGPAAPALQAPQRCLTLNSRKHAEPCLREKGRLKHIASFTTQYL